MITIDNIKAREILDSRGTPTIEVDVIVNGVVSRASVASGASTGSQEALELRDRENSRYHHKGVLQAVSNVNHEIKTYLVGKNFHSSVEVDQFLIDLDGTDNKSRLGANAILAVSIATARACASYHNLPLYSYLGGSVKLYKMPTPMINIINGGAHANNNLDFQEFMIIPTIATNFTDKLRIGAEIFYSLKKILQEKKIATTVGDEGGFAPNFSCNAQALDVVMLAIQQAGFVAGQDINLALDCAASEFYDQGLYILKNENLKLNGEAMIDYLAQLTSNYPIVSIEDGLHEQDFTGWHLLQQTLGDKIQIVGDDVFVTNYNLIAQGIQKKIANAVLIKPNQIGTLLEVSLAVELAKSHGWQTIISHRSGETEDTVIADLAVAWNCGQIKTGSITRTDRIAKYNQLLRIEEQLQGLTVIE